MSGDKMTREPDKASPTTRQSRQQQRQRAISDAVMAEGAIRIEQLAERFGTSVMTIHRDLDHLENQGLIRKNRGVATATSTAMVESSDVYRSSRQLPEKEAIAQAALTFVEPGQAIILDDSTTTLHLASRLKDRTPLTVITNNLTIISDLRATKGISLLALGGQYYNWCSAFMGRMTTEAIASLRADVLFMSTSAITDDIAFHQTQETVDVKRAMFDAAAKRILLADHTKFEKRALHAMLSLSRFDAVIVDARTDGEHITRLRDNGVQVVLARRHSRQ